ncbi:MAG: polysaccharide deacetylase family protein [Alphaproteobacteria bacterium]|nr:polysaccharide deacetylase family protein [Alphaproteobacteria bacterium]
MLAFHRILAGMAVPTVTVAAAAVMMVLVAGVPAGPAQAQAGAGESAVLLAYQRFGQGTNPDSRVRTKQFEGHIKELTNGRYAVTSVPAILDALETGAKLPNRTIGITIDGAFSSVYEEAWPRLKAAGLPFTLFVTTDPIDQGLPAYMTWDQIRELRDAGVSLGVHTAGYLRASRAGPDAFRADLDRALASFEAALGERPRLFSYPNGEMSLAVGRMLAGAGIRAAFGYHSGPINPRSELMHMPRFPIVENYADEKPFKLRVNTLALPVVDLVPADPLVNPADVSTFGFTVDPAVGRIRGINCFHSSFGQLEVNEIAERRFEAKLDRPTPKGTWRINCTMPTGGKRFRWFGMQYYSAEG